MNLTARLIGVGAYCVMLCGTCLALLWANKLSKIKSLLLIYLMALVAMGYFYIPESGADLFRLSQISATLATYSFGDVVYTLKEMGSPGARIYFYVVGLTHNPHFLPALSALIDFGLLFSIILSEVKRSSLRGACVASALFLFMSSSCLMDSISGIRNMMAYCIIVWCVYRELALKKNFLTHLPLYIVAASLHAMGQAFLIYRVIIFCFEKTSALGRVFKLVIGIVLLAGIALYAESFLNRILEKGGNYYESSQEGTGYFYIWSVVSSVIQWLVAIYEVKIFFEVKKCIKMQDPANPLFNMFRFLIPLLVAAPVLGTFAPIFFGRLMMFNFIFLIPTTLMLLNSLTTQKEQKNVQINLLLISIILLGISCSRGYLCSLKFFIA